MEVVEVMSKAVDRDHLALAVGNVRSGQPSLA